jgi:solute carrier family 35, member F1/2
LVSYFVSAVSASSSSPTQKRSTPPFTSHPSGKNYGASDAVKGDLFVILGACCYGFSNVIEEYLVSKRPMYEVIGQLGFFGMFIMGVQCAIFERTSLQLTNWNGAIAGYLVGYTLSLFILYSLTPILFRLSSAMFYNLSLLTSGTAI